MLKIKNAEERRRKRKKKKRRKRKRKGDRDQRDRIGVWAMGNIEIIKNKIKILFK